MGKLTLNGKDITKPFSWNGKNVTKLEYGGKTLTLQKVWNNWSHTLGSTYAPGVFSHTASGRTSNISSFGNMSSDTGPGQEFQLRFFGSQYCAANHSRGWNTSNGKSLTVDPKEKEIRLTFRWAIGFLRASYTAYTWPFTGYSGSKGETTLEIKYNTASNKWELVGANPAWITGTNTQAYVSFSEGSGPNFTIVVNTDNSVGYRSAIWLGVVESTGK